METINTNKPSRNKEFRKQDHGDSNIAKGHRVGDWDEWLQSVEHQKAEREDKLYLKLLINEGLDAYFNPDTTLEEGGEHLIDAGGAHLLDQPHEDLDSYVDAA